MKVHDLSCDDTLFAHIQISDESTVQLGTNEKIKKGDVIMLAERRYGRLTGQVIELEVKKVKGNQITVY